MSKAELTQLRYVLVLRCKMGYRLAKFLGLFRTLLLLFFFVGMAGSLVMIHQGETGLWMMLLFLTSLVLSIHFLRKDQFLLKTSGITLYVVYFIEYLILFIPFMVLALFSGYFILSLCGLTVCLIVPGLSWKFKNFAKREKRVRPALISGLPFEWISGFRARKFLRFALVFLGLLISWFNPFVGWILVLVLTGTVASFYKYCEAKDFIRLTGKGSMFFLISKIWQGIGWYMVLSIVFWIELVVLFPKEWIYVLLFLLVNLVLLTVVILGKYAFYHEHKDISLLISILFAFAVSCFLIPYLPPVVILLLGWLFVKANKRLKKIVYDIH